MNSDPATAAPPPPPPASSPFQPTPAFSGDKALIILSHLSALIGVGFLLPFIVWLVKKEDNQQVAAHAKEALNFHISLLIYTLCAAPLVFMLIGAPFVFMLIGIPLLSAIGIGGIVLAIVAAIKASEGKFYRYPLTIRLIG